MIAFDGRNTDTQSAPRRPGSHEPGPKPSEGGASYRSWEICARHNLDAVADLMFGAGRDEHLVFDWLDKQSAHEVVRHINDRVRGWPMIDKDHVSYFYRFERFGAAARVQSAPLK